MHRIDKTLFPTEDHENAFQRLCNNHIGELRAHKEHMRMVKKTEGLKDDDPNKYHPYPPPHAHPDVVSAVIADDDDFNIQYELFDSRTLEDKKQELIAEATQTAVDLQEKIYPMRKRNLLDHQASAVNQNVTDQFNKLAFENRTSEALAKITNALSLDDRNTIALHETVNRKTFDINYHLAKLQSDIHDLTDKTIDKFKPDPFPEV